MAGNSAKTKQVILMREDLNITSGKMIAQGSHASVSAILNKNNSKDIKNININISEEESEWFNERFTKVVLGVKNDIELMMFYDLAKEKGLNVSKPIIDAGYTELNEPTLTCIAIGPNNIERINEVTGSLRVFSGNNKEKKIRRLLRKFLKKENNLDIKKQIMESLE
jgi:PTH2 family peptidyl-tRNA hydrolase